MPHEREPLFRITTREILVYTGFAAVFCAGFVSGGRMWPAITGTITLCLLVGAGLLAFLKRGADRAFLIAFAVFVYALWSNTTASVSVLPPGSTIVSAWSYALAEWWQEGSSLTGRNSQVVAQHGFTLLLATIAAYLFRAAYISSKWKASQDEAGEPPE